VLEIIKRFRVKKDKKQIIGEVLNDEQIKSYLWVQPQGEGSIDFQLLLRAYRGLREEDFSRFITFFVAEKRDINAVNEEGKTLLNIISSHRHGDEYANALKDAGAK
jgi:hypothetical protein